MKLVRLTHFKKPNEYEDIWINPDYVVAIGSVIDYQELSFVTMIPDVIDVVIVGTPAQVATALSGSAG